MNPPWLHAASVAVLLRYLDSLDRILDAAEALAPAQQQALLQARLAPDMNDFAQQVQTAAFFALRAACPLAGRPVPPFVAAQPGIAGLRERIGASRSVLQSLDPAAFAEAELRTLHEQAGEARIELPAARFLAEYALPNFFFHLGMAYALARQHGCALGKADFDGFHVYPREQDR